MSYTREDILKSAKENHVRLVRMQFSDIFGILKNVAISVSQLEKALDGELMFDGSSIDGFVRIEESDMYLKPDYASWLVLPTENGDIVTARLICGIYTPDGNPFAGDPRYVLQRALDKAKESGYQMNIGPEAEFFLFHTDAEGNPLLKTHDKAGYFDLTPVDHGENARRDIILTLEDLGFEVEASHHECAPGQHEIDFKYADALRAADNVQTFKYVVRSVAQKHGLHASFMPKPIFGVAGSGMHVNQSLYKNGKNAFYNPDGEMQLSQEAFHYIGGLLKHAPAFTAVTNPTVNSFKRLVSGYEAPVYIAWATKNRSPLIRIPAKRGASTRIELRSPDPACNPYLAFAVMLASGLEGINKKITPPPSVECNIYELDQAEMKKYMVDTLPGSLEDAVYNLKNSSLMREAMGEHVFERFIEAKKMEWDNYRISVSHWEIEQYFNKF